LQALGAEDPDLVGSIEEFRAEELEHRDTALKAGAEDTFGYPLLSIIIRAGCRVAIALSKRI
jgi:ubiquinone biosynthesis monooxygenase Coq7